MTRKLTAAATIAAAALTVTLTHPTHIHQIHPGEYQIVSGSRCVQVDTSYGRVRHEPC